jgi:glycyl-tRNA synthetase beta chain
MIAAAGEDLRSRVLLVLDQAGVSHGDARSWGGARRLAVYVAAVASGLEGREEMVLGPPASAAFSADGQPTPAGSGFAKKQGIDPSELRKVETPKGVYAGYRRIVAGRSLEQLLAEALPASVASMSFPKTMRWGNGTHRWVRPVHWVVALHGGDVLDLQILGATAGRSSAGHRFLAPGPVVIEHPDRYVDALRDARVLVDPKERHAALLHALKQAAHTVQGELSEDDELLDELVQLVEWPGVVVGRFDPAFLDLPPEILVTTLKHHQKSFSVRGKNGLLPAFLSVANTDRDPAGHVKRGNEWVVVGRLEDARFFWNEDRKRPLASRLDDLKRVTFHKKLGSYEDKTRRVAGIAASIAQTLGPSVGDSATVKQAAHVLKADLVTGLVGEFPELQGLVGGLLLRAEGAPPTVAAAVAEHYKPVGPSDAIPQTNEACILSLADKLDTIAGLLGAGENPTGSRDPFGIRRAANGVLRIVLQKEWPLSVNDLCYFTRSEESGPASPVFSFLMARLEDFFRDRGYTANEIASVAMADNGDKSPLWSLEDIDARLQALREVRNDPEFALLVQLTARVANIGAKNADLLQRARDRGDLPDLARDPEGAAQALQSYVNKILPKLTRLAEQRSYLDIAMQLKSLAGPVDQFFKDALVIDESDLTRTHARLKALDRLQHDALTKYFDLRQLAGEADRRI